MTSFTHAKFTLRDARTHPLSVKACANSFTEITKFLTQIQIWQRHNYSCSSARISFPQQYCLSSLHPFHCYCLDERVLLLQNQLGKQQRCRWKTRCSRRKKKPSFLTQFSNQFSNPIHQRCTAQLQQQPASRNKQLGQKGVSYLSQYC